MKYRRFLYFSGGSKMQILRLQAFFVRCFFNNGIIYMQTGVYSSQNNYEGIELIM